MPFTSLLNAGPPLLFLLLVASSWAGALAGGLVYRRSRRSLRRGARWSMGLLVIALLLLLGHGVLVGLLSGFGWRFVAERLALAPLLLPPALAVASLSLPTLWRLAGLLLDAPDAEPAPDERALAARPALILPPRLLALGAAVGIYQSAVVPFLAAPALATLWAIFCGYGLLLWLLPGRAERAIREGHLARLGLPWRLLRLALVLGLLLGGGAVAVGRSAAASRLPERYSLMDHATIDLGGGSPVSLAGHGHAAGGVVQAAAAGAPSVRSVTELAGPRDATPDVRFTLTARQQTLRLRSGATVEAWSFNGQIPGPELRVRQGDLVEVELVNQDIAAGVSIHWHGVNVPNAEDGVAGVTQDAVRPGGRHIYRFVATDEGTRWYHSHQQSSEQVRRGLFGALIVEPREPTSEQSADLELTITAHGWPTADGVVEALGVDDTLVRQAIPAGREVRLRLLNADDRIRSFALNGAPFRVIALDGNPIHEPAELRDVAVAIPGGGRADLLFTMPDGPVRLGQLERPWLGYAFSSDGEDEPPPLRAEQRFDPLAYGSPVPTPFGPASAFDRSFLMVFDNTLGFYDGRFGTLRTINGAVHPNTPAQMVREGELIRLVLVNRSHVDHPMHLHGHHVLVLSRNGEPTRGSPLWLDTVSVLPGETWEVAFRADNPGIWMDHCHNLEHVATGMMMHLAYEGVTTPFEAGTATGNSPE